MLARSGASWVTIVIRAAGPSTAHAANRHEDDIMPETTETATFARPAQEVFDLLADFGNLADWDPMFEESMRLDDGPVDVGSRFKVKGTIAGSAFDLDMEVVEYDRPQRVVVKGTGDGLETLEDISVHPTNEGCEVTYHSRFETDKPDIVDTASKPAFVAIGKRAINGMQEWIAG
jgi:carbon monoxide dehydrogenase subunit G